MNALALAIALSVASAGAYAAGAVVQERVASYGASLLRSLRDRHWWLSVALNGAGAGLHVAALAFGPLSIVQPLGLLTLVFALPMGAAVIGRRVAGAHWRGAGLTIAGLTLLVITAPLGSARALSGTEVLAVAAGGALLVTALVVTATRVRARVPASLLYATAAGIAFAASSALTQTVSLEVTAEGPLAVLSLTSLALALFSAAGLLLSQAAYRDGGLGAPLATVSLANPAASAAIGMLLLGERFIGGATGGGVALTGAALAMWGVLLLTHPAPDDNAPLTAAPDEADEYERHVPRHSLPAGRHGRHEAGSAPADRTADSGAVAADQPAAHAGSGADPAGPGPQRGSETSGSESGGAESANSESAGPESAGPECPTGDGQAAIPGRRRAQIAVGARGLPSCAVPGGTRRRLIRPGRGFRQPGDPRPGRRPTT